MATDAQIEANRHNSTSSSGPKDTKKTRFNAVKHGLCSKHFISKKEKKDYLHIYNSLVNEIQPLNAFEFIVVERIASSMFDLQRIANKESAQQYNGFVKKERDLKILDREWEAMKQRSHNPEAWDQDKSVSDKLIPEWDFDDLLMRYKNEAESRLFRSLTFFTQLRKE
jgi:hypothetical protein